MSRPLTILVLDGLATGLAWGLAVVVRFEGQLTAYWLRATLVSLCILVACRLVALWAAKLQRWSFSMAGLSEGLRLVTAMLAGSVAAIAFVSLLVPGVLPRSIWALEFFIATTLVAAMRFGPRAAFTWWGERVRRQAGAAPTLIVGVGGPAEILARDVCRSPGSPYHLVGFVGTCHSSGMRLAGKPVLGELPQLPALIGRYGIRMVLLADPDLSASAIRHTLAMCDRTGTRFKIVPASFSSQVDQRISAAMLHDLSPSDLLPRQEVDFDERELGGLVRGSTALVTGAGGSIGGEACRQLARHGVRRLVMVDLNENEMYLRSRELAEERPDLEVFAEVADIRERAPLMRLGKRYRPDFVLHAAAHKHVPLMEAAPGEAVKNNVFGTLNVARMAAVCGAERFVLVSTDKAVNPTSVMGATKRVAEMVVSDLGHSSGTRMTSVRFGNVLGSAGSVVPLFRQQIARGGPVTVTHPDCTRYFMTIPEAVGLVLMAGLSNYGELCVLEMGEPIRIADLAKSFITLSGHLPDEEIQIVYTGLRAGEKLHEELLTEQEEHTLKVRDRIWAVRSPAAPQDFAEQLAALRGAAEEGDREGVLRALRRLVPSYRASSREAAEKSVGATKGLDLASARTS
ncbi:MAG: nucleoside-diphosphate sugar epimerase/dehydratase [Myxococcales bacterium]